MFQQDSRRYRNPFWCLWMQPISKKNTFSLALGPMTPRHFLETDFQKTEIPLASPPTTKETLVIGVVQLWQIMCIIVCIYIYINIISYYVCMYIIYIYNYIHTLCTSLYFANLIYITLQPASPRRRSRNRSPACEETTWSSLQASRSQRPCSSKAEPSEKATCSCLPGGSWRMTTKILGS